MKKCVDILTRSCGYHYVNYDYDEERDCEVAGCDSICRCSKITATRITSINSFAIANDVMELLDSEDPSLRDVIENYIKNKVSESDFDIAVSGGYYGDEIDYVKMNHSKAVEILEFALSVRNKSTSDLVQQALLLHHGYVLNQHENINVEQKKISYKELISKALMTNKFADINKVKRFDIPDQCSGLILEENNGRYKIIDGNHRFQALLNIIDRNIKNKYILYDQKDLNSFLKRNVRRLKKTIEVRFITRKNEEQDSLEELKKMVLNLQKQIDELRKAIHK